MRWRSRITGFSGPDCATPPLPTDSTSSTAMSCIPPLFLNTKVQGLPLLIYALRAGVVALLSGLELAVGTGFEALDVLSQVEIAVKIGDRFLHALERDLMGAHPAPGTLHEIGEVKQILAQGRLRLGKLRRPDDLLALAIDELERERHRSRTRRRVIHPDPFLVAFD